MYYWLICNTESGTIGANSSTHPPTVSVTVKDAEGNEATTQEFDPSLLPSGFSLIGLYDDANPMDSATQTAYDNPAAWLYQGGKFVANPAYDANAIALAQAKATQSALINSAYANAMSAGVTSSANGTSQVYLVSDTTISDVGLIAARPEAKYPTEGVKVELLDDTYVTLDYAQMQTFSDDLQTFYLPIRDKRITLLQSIKAATTVTEVQAISW